jgi:hypothetical protein
MLDLFLYDISDGVDGIDIGVSGSLQDSFILFYYIFSLIFLYKLQGGKMREKNKKIILKSNQF